MPLNELGLVGFILGGAFIFTVAGFGVRNLVRSRERRERAATGTILSMITIYLIHTSFDWDWNVFAVTMPFFFFAGMLVSWPVRSGAAPGTDPGQEGRPG